MTPKEQFLCITSNDPLHFANVIVVLEGDGLVRLKEAARLYKVGLAPTVVISGGLINPPHSIPSPEMLPHLVALGVPQDAIILEEKSQNTREQGIEIMRLSEKHGWEKIILVASHYHQYRAYLTFLRAMQDSKQKIVIINAPARDLPWFADGKQGRRIDLLSGEFDRIEPYTSKGHVASYQEAIAYQEWKESQLQ